MVQLLSMSTQMSSLAAEIKRGSGRINHSVGKLSSGKRILSASEDVASISVATRMTTRLASYRSAQINVAQASSLLQIADDALRNAQEILQRMNALASQAGGNGTLTDQERVYLDTEFQFLKDDLETIFTTTRFNEQLIFVDSSKVANSVLEDASFTPDIINDLVLWLDGSDGATIQDASGNTALSSAFTGNVALWEDKSSNENDVSQANAADQPTYVAGGLGNNSVLSFDGVSERLVGTVPTTTQQLTTFSLFSRDSAVGGRVAMFDYGSNGENSRDGIFLDSDMPTYLEANPVGFYNYTDTITYGNFELISSRIDVDQLTGHLNGVQELNRVTGGRQRDPSLAFVIGDDSTSFDWFNGDIAEHIGYERALTDNERFLLEGYLGHKYDVMANLPGTHLFAERGPGIYGETVSVENISDGDVVGSFDEHLNNLAVDYQIISGNDAGAFSISSTGQIMIADAGSIEDGEQEYMLEIEASVGNGTMTLNATINTNNDKGITFQIGDKATEILNISIGALSIESVLGDTSINLLSKEAGEAAFSAVTAGIDIITDRRAYVGSMQSRADVITGGLQSAIINQDASRANLEEADIAVESTLYSTHFAKHQASIAISAQTTNLRQDLVLSTMEGLNLISTL